MLFFIYLYGAIGIILLFYVIVEKKRLRFYRELNRMRRKQSDIALLDIPIHTLSRVIRSTILPLSRKETDILFEYRDLVYIATPLGKHAIVLSQVPGSSIAEYSQ